MLMHFVDIGKKPPVFEDAARVALEILQTPYEFDFGELYYNVFKYLSLSFFRVYCSFTVIILLYGDRKDILTSVDKPATIFTTKFAYRVRPLSHWKFLFRKLSKIT